MQKTLQLGAGEVQFGRTKVFIRQPDSLFAFESLRKAKIERSVSKIQRCWRRYVARRHLIQLRAKTDSTFTSAKERRRQSVEGAFEGLWVRWQHLEVPREVLRRHADANVVFADRVERIHFSRRGAAREKALVVLTKKKLYVFGGATEDEAKAAAKLKLSAPKYLLRRDVPIEAIDGATLSTFADNFVALKARRSSTRPYPSLRHTHGCKRPLSTATGALAHSRARRRSARALRAPASCRRRRGGTARAARRARARSGSSTASTTAVKLASPPPRTHPHPPRPRARTRNTPPLRTHTHTPAPAPAPAHPPPRTPAPACTRAHAPAALRRSAPSGMCARAAPCACMRVRARTVGRGAPTHPAPTGAGVSGGVFCSKCSVILLAAPDCAAECRHGSKNELEPVRIATSKLGLLACELPQDLVFDCEHKTELVAILIELRRELGRPLQPTFQNGMSVSEGGTVSFSKGVGIDKAQARRRARGRGACARAQGPRTRRSRSSRTTSSTSPAPAACPRRTSRSAWPCCATRPRASTRSAVPRWTSGGGVTPSARRCASASGSSASRRRRRGAPRPTRR